MKIEDFGRLEDSMLTISWGDIFERFRVLDKLTLVVPEGEDWIDKCRRKFEEEALKAWRMDMDAKLLEIDIAEVHK